MITEKDLQDAIAECQGERKPNANTCIKLAAYFTIYDHLFPKEADFYIQTQRLGETFDRKNRHALFPAQDMIDIADIAAHGMCKDLSLDIQLSHTPFDSSDKHILQPLGRSAAL